MGAELCDVRQKRRELHLCMVVRPRHHLGDGGGGVYLHRRHDLCPDDGRLRNLLRRDHQHRLCECVRLHVDGDHGGRARCRILPERWLRVSRAGVLASVQIEGATLDASRCPHRNVNLSGTPFAVSIGTTACGGSMSCSCTCNACNGPLVACPGLSLWTNGGSGVAQVR